MATRKKSRTKTPARGHRTRKARPVGILLPVSYEERWRMIAEAAYYIAQRRGFMGGDSVADWLAAEAEVDGRLKAGGLEPGNS